MANLSQISHPGEIRTIQFQAIEAMGWEAYCRELMSFLTTDDLRQFAETLQDEDLHQF